MNKRQIIASLNKIANQLDNSGLYKEASSLTNVMKRLADEFDIDSDPVSINNKPEELNKPQQTDIEPFIQIRLVTMLDDAYFAKKEGFSIGREGDVKTPRIINTVSRQHCFITPNRYKKWSVYDLDSKGGTMLNGKILSPRQGQELKINDVITLDPNVLVEITDMYPSNEEQFKS